MGTMGITTTTMATMGISTTGTSTEKSLHFLFYYNKMSVTNHLIFPKGEAKNGSGALLELIARREDNIFNN
jgi:hypothetical protein